VINDKKVLLIVMEFMEGGELFFKITKNAHLFTEKDAAKIMFQICTAVSHLHKLNIAHRDLKPENLLLSTNDENAVLKLTDFGFAKEVLLGLKTPCFTPYYVAPEILKAKLAVTNYTLFYDIACDIWSLGVIMYILLCGYPPFYAQNNKSKITPNMRRKILEGTYSFPDKEWAHTSSAAKQLIDGMLQTDPTKRFTIDEVMKSEWIKVRGLTLFWHLLRWVFN
jgi:mitogen-activated protein kinase-activated protein kinase 2